MLFLKSLVGLHRTVQFSIFSVTGWGIDLGYHDIEWFYEDLQNLLELTPQKDVLLIIGDWNAKVGSQETPEIKASLALSTK